MTLGRHVWITRAEPGATRTAERLTALGWEPLAFPLLAIRHLKPPLDLHAVQGLAFTSSNGVSAFTALSARRDFKVFTVGDATARAARESGFETVRSASGDVAALGALIRQSFAGGGVILHPGAREPAGDLAVGVGGTATVRAVAVYETFETGASAPDGFAAVMIHSPRAASALAATLTPRAAFGRVAVAISPTAAEPIAGLGFAAVHVAAHPDETAMTAALGKPPRRV